MPDDLSYWIIKPDVALYLNAYIVYDADNKGHSRCSWSSDKVGCISVTLSRSKSWVWELSFQYVVWRLSKFFVICLGDKSKSSSFHESFYVPRNLVLSWLSQLWENCIEFLKAFKGFLFSMQLYRLLIYLVFVNCPNEPNQFSFTSIKLIANIQRELAKMKVFVFKSKCVLTILQKDSHNVSNPSRSVQNRLIELN